MNKPTYCIWCDAVTIMTVQCDRCWTVGLSLSKMKPAAVARLVNEKVSGVTATIDKPPETNEQEAT